MDKRFTGIGLGMLLAVVSAVTMAALGHPASSIVQNSPTTAMGVTRVKNVGTAAVQGLADCTSAGEDSSRHYVIQNTDTAKQVCFYTVARGASCGSSWDCDLSDNETDSGYLVQPGAAVKRSFACDLRLCLVASASSAIVHVSGDEL